MNLDMIIPNIILFYLENKNIYKYYISVFNILFDTHL